MCGQLTGFLRIPDTSFDVLFSIFYALVPWVFGFCYFMVQELCLVLWFFFVAFSIFTSLSISMDMATHLPLIILFMDTVLCGYNSTVP